MFGRRGAQSPGADRVVPELTAAGSHVAVRALDVANLDAVRALMADIRRDGPPLAGVFHAAMVLDDEWLSSLDARRFDAVMAPKALGAWHLHTCTVDDPIEHFVLFSSVAQVLGNVKQGAYCAANGFLDGLARRRRADGRPALAIAWDSSATRASRRGPTDWWPSSNVSAFVPSTPRRRSPHWDP